MQYSEKLLHYFYTATHAGTLNENNPQVKKGEVGRAAEGNVLHLYLQKENHHIVAATFLATGPVAAIASCEFVCCWLEGRTMSDAQQITAQAIMQTVEMPTTQFHVAVQVERLVKKTISLLQGE